MPARRAPVGPLVSRARRQTDRQGATQQFPLANGVVAAGGADGSRRWRLGLGFAAVHLGGGTRSSVATIRHRGHEVSVLPKNVSESNEISRLRLLPTTLHMI